MMHTRLLTWLAVGTLLTGCSQAGTGNSEIKGRAAMAQDVESNQPEKAKSSATDQDQQQASSLESRWPQMSDAEWKRLPLADWQKRLTTQQFKVTRRAATERAFTGEYWDSKKQGVYRCVCCGLPLFSSETKFDSGTGWPSYWQPINPKAVATKEDRGFFSVRTEVVCARCDAHLGHVFDDAPQTPTGLRYCMNSAALVLEEKEPEDDQK